MYEMCSGDSKGTGGDFSRVTVTATTTFAQTMATIMVMVMVSVSVIPKFSQGKHSSENPQSSVLTLLLSSLFPTAIITVTVSHVLSYSINNRLIVVEKLLLLLLLLLRRITVS